MNQAQRNFLINKIKEQVKSMENAYGHREDPPSLNIYLLHAVMSGNFKIKSTEELKEIIRQRALQSKEREDWLVGSTGGWSNDRASISFKADEFFEVPEEYKKLKEEHDMRKAKMDKELSDFRLQADTLITRIQLASDKTLQTMINEIDDMGNLSLMESKLRLLT